jgi:hypothetical protein
MGKQNVYAAWLRPYEASPALYEMHVHVPY